MMPPLEVSSPERPMAGPLDCHTTPYDLIKHQGTLNPKAIAVTFGDNRLTFDEATPAVAERVRTPFSCRSLHG
jgi:hypothetical protein